ncbi:MAG: methyltransferase [Pseudomonadota bacterium]
MIKTFFSSEIITWRGLLNALANLTAILLFSLVALSSYRHFQNTGSPLSFGLVLVNGVFVTLFLIRREPKAVSPHLFAWILAAAGTIAPLLFRPVESVLSSTLFALGHGVQVLGAVMILVALLSLRRSFGIVPANRGIQAGGLYRLVRHPLYAAELLFFLGFVLAHPSIGNIVLWVVELGLQFSRARVEESFLREDPVYQWYLSRVRYRLIPGLL